MAGFFYGFGCSLIHLALFVAIHFVQRPNVERAKELDQEYYGQLEAILERGNAQGTGAMVSLQGFGRAKLKKLIADDRLNFCEREADKINDLITYLIVVHVYSTIICLYRELFEVRIGFFGGIMKMLEVIGVYLYLALIILSLGQFSFWMYQLTDSSLQQFVNFDNHEARKIALSVSPACLKDRSILSEWAGGSLYWITIEIIVNLCYVATMMILLAKSRLFSVGIDNTQ